MTLATTTSSVSAQRMPRMFHPQLGLVQQTLLSMFMLIFSLFVSGCMIPGTYYDPFDEYVRGVRFFDNGKFEMARVRWERLAKEGDCDAQFRLGTLYFLGTGVPLNYEIARQWLVTAATRGQAFAQGLMALMFAHDVDRGNIDGMKILRFDCSLSCGVEKDMFQAYKWQRLAERSAVYEISREGAKKVAAKYGQHLATEQMREAERQIAAWKPSPAQCHQRRLL